MKNRLYHIGSALLLASMTAVPALGSADPAAAPGNMHGMTPMMEGPHHHGKMAHGSHSGGHDWEALLSAEQKAEIDWITLRSSQRQQLLKAQMDVKEAELNQLILGEDVMQDQWYAKIDELLQLKREYLINHYQRMIETRQVLTPQQRVVFDLDVFSRR